MNNYRNQKTVQKNIEIKQKLLQSRNEKMKSYKSYESYFGYTKRKSKKIYYLSKLLEFRNNAKKIWGVMKELIGKIRNIESSFPKTFVILKKEMSEIKVIAEEFHNFFTNVGPNLAKKSPKFLKLIH